MGKTIEYPKEFKIKAIKTYLSGDHGRLYKSGKYVWNDRY
jgi:hypothetical protein